MINKLLQFLAPHHCCSCSKTGLLLCDNCKYDIGLEPFEGCIVCEAPSRSGICLNCQTSFEKAWCVGNRTGALELLINQMKFERAKEGADILADLLSDRLPMLPQSTVIVPIPTVQAHIRQRGYDHTLLVARRLAKMRRVALQPSLKRLGNTQQRGKTKAERLKQARTAFQCSAKLHPDVPYLLIDDVTTTSATLRYAAEVLKNAGASTVWVAVAARQPLDKK